MFQVNNTFIVTFIDVKGCSCRSRNGSACCSGSLIGRKSFRKSGISDKTAYGDSQASYGYVYRRKTYLPEIGSRGCYYLSCGNSPGGSTVGAIANIG